MSNREQVITFYSFKGGTGRSMALANTAVLLTQWGYKTLTVDWDFDAPGLENFFKNHDDELNFRYFKGDRELNFEAIVEETVLLIFF